MTMLISLVNNLASGTAMDIDIHFAANLCKSVKETWLESSIASTREMDFWFLSGDDGRPANGSRSQTQDKELITKAECNQNYA